MHKGHDRELRKGDTYEVAREVDAGLQLALEGGYGGVREAAGARDETLAAVAPLLELAAVRLPLEVSREVDAEQLQRVAPRGLHAQRLPCLLAQLVPSRRLCFGHFHRNFPIGYTEDTVNTGKSHFILHHNGHAAK